MTNVWPHHLTSPTGTWKCISFTLLDPTTRTPLPKPSNPSHPLAHTPNGRISISPQGWLAAHLTLPDRTPSPSSATPWSTASDSEVAHIARGLTMYCGYIKLYEDAEGGLYWQCEVEICTDPRRLGGVQERKVVLERGEDGREVMVLEPKQDLVLEDGTKARGVLKWEKFE